MSPSRVFPACNSWRCRPRQVKGCSHLGRHCFPATLAIHLGGQNKWQTLGVHQQREKPLLFGLSMNCYENAGQSDPVSAGKNHPLYQYHYCTHWFNITMPSIERWRFFLLLFFFANFVLLVFPCVLVVWFGKKRVSRLGSVVWNAIHVCPDLFASANSP